MKRLMLILLPIVLFAGCKFGDSGSGSFINATNAGADIYISSNSVKGLEGNNLTVKVLEKYNNPLIVVEEAVGMKSYPDAEYSKTVKKYNGNELASVSIEIVHPVTKSKPNNVPYKLLAAVLVFGILCNVLVKVLKK